LAKKCRRAKGKQFQIQIAIFPQLPWPLARPGSNRFFGNVPSSWKLAALASQIKGKAAKQIEHD
jgi:hypothetical protein